MTAAELLEKAKACPRCGGRPTYENGALRANAKKVIASVTGGGK